MSLQKMMVAIIKSTTKEKNKNKTYQDHFANSFNRNEDKLQAKYKYEQLPLKCPCAKTMKNMINISPKYTIFSLEIEDTQKLDAEISCEGFKNFREGALSQHFQIRLQRILKIIHPCEILVFVIFLAVLSFKIIIHDFFSSFFNGRPNNGRI